MQIPTIPFRNVLMLSQTIAPTTAPRRVEPVGKRFWMPEPKREGRPVLPAADQDREDPERWDGLA
jgi:hypothetical protein